MGYNELAYKVYSIKIYGDNTGMAIIIGISEIVKVEFWSLVLLYRVGGRWSFTLIFLKKLRRSDTISSLTC